jgi:hypothetical protein
MKLSENPGVIENKTDLPAPDSLVYNLWRFSEVDELTDLAGSSPHNCLHFLAYGFEKTMLDSLAYSML